MDAAAVEIADGVALELETIDDEGRRSFGFGSGGGLVFVLVFGSFQVLRLGVAKDKNQASAVRRPFEIVNALRNVGEVSGFATKAIEKPDLGFATISGGEEGKVLAVGAPARMRGGDAFRRQGDGISAVSGNHPEALLVLIFREHAGAHGVNDSLAVDTDLGFRA